nr:MAG TPA: hypothetical protein [Caudoviricetes sp.]
MILMLDDRLFNLVSLHKMLIEFNFNNYYHLTFV